MDSYAILCGSAPDGYRQKKLIDKHDFLISKGGGSLSESHIITFPSGVSEFFLEGALNSALCEEPDELVLYFCTRTESDLNALSECEAVGFGKLEVVLLGKEEIRKEVIEYYADNICKEYGVNMRVVYEADSDFVSDEDCGFERVGMSKGGFGGTGDGGLMGCNLGGGGLAKVGCGGGL